MPFYVVTIQDKDLPGEPDIAMGIVDTGEDDAQSHLLAIISASSKLEELAKSGRYRCVPHIRRVELGEMYRVSALVRLSRSNYE